MKSQVAFGLLVIVLAGGNAAASIVTVNGETTTLTATVTDDCLGIAYLNFSIHSGSAPTPLDTYWGPFNFFLGFQTQVGPVPGGWLPCDFNIEGTSVVPIEDLAQAKLGIYLTVNLVTCPYVPYLLTEGMGGAEAPVALVYDYAGFLQPAEFVWVGDAIIPEPATMSMMAIGAIALLRRRRRA